MYALRRMPQNLMNLHIRLQRRLGSQLCTCGAFQAWLSSRRMWSASHLNQLAAPFLAFFDAPDVVNPFLQEMRRRNLYKGGVFLPDFYEQSAAAGFAAVQTGKWALAWCGKV